MTREQQETCEHCGSERVAVVDRDAEARRNPAPAEPGNDEPVTHCEWCGAEYPIPKESSSAD